MAVLLGLMAPLRRAGRPAAFVSVAGALVALAGAVALLAGGDAALKPGVHLVYGWLSAGPATAVGIHVDGTSAWMLLVVTLVATCVQSSRWATCTTSRPPRSVVTSPTRACSCSR